MFQSNPNAMTGPQMTALQNYIQQQTGQVQLPGVPQPARGMAAIGGFALDCLNS